MVYWSLLWWQIVTGLLFAGLQVYAGLVRGAAPAQLLIPTSLCKPPVVRVSSLSQWLEGTVKDLILGAPSHLGTLSCGSLTN